MRRKIASEHRGRKGERRRGIVTLETVLAVPMLVIVSFAAFLFATIMVGYAGLVHAATEAAREAAKVASTIAATDDVENAAESTLDDVLSTTYGVSVGAGTVGFIIEDSTGTAFTGANIGPAAPCGAPDCEDATTTIIDPAVVRVRVRVNFTDMHIPNLLQTFCVDFTGYYFEVCAEARRDCI